jgi:hypothetical protein
MSIFDYTPSTIRDNPDFAWQALKAAIEYNPGQISSNLQSMGFSDAPATGVELYEYVQTALVNGQMFPTDLQTAMGHIPVSPPKFGGGGSGKSSSSGGGNFDWNSLGQIGGVILSTLFPTQPGGNNNAAGQAQAAAAQAALQQQKTMNNILLIGGILVVAVVVLVIWKKK